MADSVKIKPEGEKQWMFNLEITSEDLETFGRVNPLGSEQLKNIALLRIIRRQEEEMFKLRNGQEAEEKANATP